MVATDLELALSWRNHPKVRSYMLSQHVISLEEHRAWFADASQDLDRRLLIVEEAKEPVGFVKFVNVNDCGVANWGFYVSPEAAKGSGRKLGVTALGYAFSQLRLHKVCGQALAFNTGSVGLHKSLGFVEEGVLRDQCRIDGEYHNLMCFGLLAHEWQSHLTG